MTTDTEHRLGEEDLPPFRWGKSIAIVAGVVAVSGWAVDHFLTTLTVPEKVSWGIGVLGLAVICGLTWEFVAMSIRTRQQYSGLADRYNNLTRQLENAQATEGERHQAAEAAQIADLQHQLQRRAREYHQMEIDTLNMQEECTKLRTLLELEGHYIRTMFPIIMELIRDRPRYRLLKPEQEGDIIVFLFEYRPMETGYVQQEDPGLDDGTELWVFRALNYSIVCECKIIRRGRFDGKWRYFARVTNIRDKLWWEETIMPYVVPSYTTDFNIEAVVKPTMTEEALTG